MQPHGVLWQTLRAVTPRDLAADDRAHHAVDVADRQFRRDLLAALDRGCAEIEQLA